MVNWISSVRTLKCLFLHWLQSYEGNPACLLYSNTSVISGTQMGSASAKCSEDTKSFMMAEKAGRSLKLHIQQYLIRSYLKIEKDLVSVELIKETFTTHESLSCRKSEHTILVIGRRSKRRRQGDPSPLDMDLDLQPLQPLCWEDIVRQRVMLIRVRLFLLDGWDWSLLPETGIPAWIHWVHK